MVGAATMASGLDPLSFLVVSFAGWINQRQQHVTEYLAEENRALREQIGRRRMRFTDEQRRRLATRAKMLTRKVLQQVATIVIPLASAKSPINVGPPIHRAGPVISKNQNHAASR